MCNVLPKQSTGLFRRICTIRFYMLLVGENSYVSQTNSVCLPDPHPFSAFWTFNCAPARRVAALRAEYSRWRAKCEGFALTLPLPFVSKRKRKPIADAVVSM